MDKDFEMNGLDWTERGYFGVPSPPAAPRPPADDPWLLWTTALHRAKGGDFALLPSIVPLCKSDDPVLRQSASYLLGDAGTPACFQSIAQEIDRPDNVWYTLEFCGALYLRGSLSDVPLLLRAFERIAADGDADIIPVWLSDLLEPEDDVLSEPSRFEELGEYCKAVMERYEQLSREFGTDQIFIFRGKRFGVVGLAKYILGRVRRPFVRQELRHKFEASTGIDCSGFYRNGEVQPLRAAAIVEEFLESPGAAGYEEGVRYFFGHRIPDRAAP